MALALGGATLTWWALRGDSAARATALEIAAGYERAFWAATGVLVMTGVGNLGSLAPYVPDRTTPWGTAFAVKLLLVLAVLALSLVRTLVVARYRRAADAADAGEATSSNSATDTLRTAYGATALALAVLVALAEVLAHG
ncbi:MULTISPECIES: CopD family protein [Halorussus]|uniref:CopD family protein n=1 Tax=Halorussus TaxID=1070314 RepID=UPI000E21AE9B|nr:CopD family protein [Halorussus sp. JP-T4]NHN58406.1 hypothetical protein [Halorussus sp. JP-T4]